ncbi:MAG: translation initiation factor IF-2 N-terminal domain-containing protein, partial [Myxococcota bacterium]|nr:translation initiation factor IF-2 N-terminal domain-containing protein [Myxococcota bacterium]
MAKVRAYKIAEELGLEKDEFLRRAGEIGISLRSALVGIEEDQADEIRRRLGGKGSAERVETRVG